MTRIRESLARVSTTLLLMPLGCGPLGAGVTATAEALATSEAEEATQGAIATATAEVRGSATARANSIATQRAGAQATRKADTTATAEAAMTIFGVPEGFRLRLYEDFDNSRTQQLWYADESNNDFSREKLGPEDGAYVWEARAKQAYISWVTPSISPGDDFFVSVDAWLEEGEPASRYGIVFRSIDNENFYIFYLNSKGYYWVYRIKDDYWLQFKANYSKAILPGNSINTLAVLGIDDSFTFYINGQLVDTMKDSEFGKGDAGLLIELPYGGAETVMKFDNFTLLSP